MIPAPTIVLEWGRAEIEIGPSIAEDSYGWRQNWANFPVVASMSPIRGKFELFKLSIKICCKPHAFKLNRNHAIAVINPISPIWLYKITCRAAAHPYNHLISRKDVILTPHLMWETWAWYLGQEDPLEKGMTTQSSILAWRIPWTVGPGWLHSPGGRKESDTTEQWTLCLLMKSWKRLLAVTRVNIAMRKRKRYLKFSWY